MPHRTIPGPGRENLGVLFGKKVGVLFGVGWGTIGAGVWWGRSIMRDSVTVAVGVFLAMLVHFFWPVLDGDAVWTFRDLLGMQLPVEVLHQRLQKYEFPVLWNPYQGLGKPLFADLQLATLVPLTAVARLFPFPLSFSVNLLLHHLLGALGMFTLCRALNIKYQGALLAGIVFTFGGYVVSCDSYPNGLQSVVMVPWLMAAAVSYASKSSRGAFLALAIALMLTVLGGFPECLAMADAMILTGAFAYHARWPFYRALGLAHIAGFLLGAVQFFPTLQYLLLSSESRLLTSEGMLRFSLQPALSLGLIVPPRLLQNAIVNPLALNVEEIPWALSIYVGLGLVLLLPAIRNAPRHFLLPAALLVSGSIILSWGSYLPEAEELLNALPFLRVARYPEKLLLIPQTLLAIGIGFGFSSVIAKYRSASVTMCCTVCTLLLAYLDLSAQHRGILPTSSWASLSKLPLWAAQIAPRLRNDDDALRIYGNTAEGVVAVTDSHRNAQSTNLMIEQLAAVHGASNVVGGASINTDEFTALHKFIHSLPAENRITFLGMLGVNLITSPSPLTLPGLSLIYQDTSPAPAYVYEVQPLVARAYLPSTILCLTSKEETQAAIKNSQLAVGDTSIQTDETCRQTRSPEPDTADSISITEYLPSTVKISVTTKHPRYVVLNDSFFPGWSATVNHTPSAIIRANYFARAVRVPAGQSMVEFRYRPAPLLWGFLVSILTWSVSFIWWLKGRNTTD